MVGIRKISNICICSSFLLCRSQKNSAESPSVELQKWLCQSCGSRRRLAGTRGESNAEGSETSSVGMCLMDSFLMRRGYDAWFRTAVTASQREKKKEKAIPHFHQHHNHHLLRRMNFPTKKKKAADELLNPLRVSLSKKKTKNQTFVSFLSMVCLRLLLTRLTNVNMNLQLPAGALRRTTEQFAKRKPSQCF